MSAVIISCAALGKGGGVFGCLSTDVNVYHFPHLLA